MPALVDSTGRTSKASLITALATSLQKEKIRSSKLCKELEITEEKVEQQHQSLLAEKDRLSSLSQSHDLTIQSLRKELEEANKVLQAATNLSDSQAEQFSSLLLDHPYSTQRAVNAMNGSGRLENGAAQGGEVTAKERTRLRLKKLDEEIRDEALRIETREQEGIAASRSLQLQQQGKDRVERQREEQSIREREEIGYGRGERFEKNDGHQKAPIWKRFSSGGKK